jgi:transposase
MARRFTPRAQLANIASRAKDVLGVEKLEAVADRGYYSGEEILAVRAAQLAEDRSELFAAVDPLLKAREAVEQQILDLDRKVLRLARNNAQVRRFMTAPGIGATTS